MGKRAGLANSIRSSKLAENMKALSEPTAHDPVALVEKAQSASPILEAKPLLKRYEGMKKMLIPLEPSIHKKLKMMAVDRGMTLEKMVQEAILTYISDK